MPGWMASLAEFSPVKAAGLGVAVSAANPKNLILTAAAAATIAQAGLDAGQETIAIAVFVVLGSVTVVGAVLFFLVGGRRAAAPLATMRTFMAHNNAIIMMVVLGLLGLKILGDGLGGVMGERARHRWPASWRWPPRCSSRWPRPAPPRSQAARRAVGNRRPRPPRRGRHSPTRSVSDWPCSRSTTGPRRVGSYRRDDWPHWEDTDGNGCDARQDTLITWSTTEATLDRSGRRCKVLTGTWVSPYDGAVADSPTAVEIDHVVPLAEAFRSGGWRWDAGQRRRFANDQVELAAASSASNRAKADSRPDQWRPRRSESWCAYADRWVTVKATYGLTVTSSERDALGQMLDTCTDSSDRWPAVSRRAEVAMRQLTNGWSTRSPVGEHEEVTGTLDVGPLGAQTGGQLVRPLRRDQPVRRASHDQRRRCERAERQAPWAGPGPVLLGHPVRLAHGLGHRAGEHVIAERGHHGGVGVAEASGHRAVRGPGHVSGQESEGPERESGGPGPAFGQPRESAVHRVELAPRLGLVEGYRAGHQDESVDPVRDQRRGGHGVLPAHRPSDRAHLVEGEVVEELAHVVGPGRGGAPRGRRRAADAGTVGGQEPDAESRARATAVSEYAPAEESPRGGARRAARPQGRGSARRASGRR